MADKVGDEYHGHITGVAPFGLFVELIEHYVEGLVHISSMADDYYRFTWNSSTPCAGRTRNGSIAWETGSSVQVVRVNMERRQVELGLVEVLEAVRRDGAAAWCRQEQGDVRKATVARPSGLGRRERTLQQEGQEGKDPREKMRPSLGRVRPFFCRVLEVL